MDSIKINNLGFQGYVQNLRNKNILPSRISDFSFEFHFGKSYMLYSQPSQGSWGISWIIGGAMEADTGTIKYRSTAFTSEHRRKISWFVRYSSVKFLGRFHQSVKSQIKTGLRKSNNHLSEEEIISIFQLTEVGYNRHLTQMREESWRASLAIGYTHQKRVFCFPHLGYLYDEEYDLFKLYGDLWLGDIIRYLTNAGALVLIPTHRLEQSSKYVDEVVTVE